jgi:hypothetical protein
MRAYEVDNNEHTNCHKYEHSKIDGLCDENVVDEQDHIFDELIKIHNNINIEQTCTTSSYLQLEAQYFTCNAIKTNYVIYINRWINNIFINRPKYGLTKNTKYKRYLAKY